MKKKGLLSLFILGLLFWACSSDPVAVVKPDALTVDDFNSLNCDRLRMIPGLIFADRAGDTLYYDIPSVSAEYGEPVLEYSMANPSIASVETQTVNGVPKIKIRALKAGETEMRIKATSPDFVLKKDINGDGVADMTTYHSTVCSETYIVKVKSGEILNVLQSNTLVLDVSSIPANILGEEGKSVMYDLATATTTRGTPMISYAILNPDIATVQKSGNKIQIQFVKSGNASLAVIASISDLEVEEDFDGDGVLDNVTYEANLTEAQIPISVMSINTGSTASQNYTLNNTLTLNTGNIPSLISGVAGQSIEYDEATASSSKGTPVITYAINNNKPSVVTNNQVVATVQHSNGKIHIEFLQSGNASLTVEATVAEVVENVDYNQDGALDKVTYSPAFRSAWIPMEVGSAGTNPAPQNYTLNNTLTLNTSNIPSLISGVAGQSIEYDEATASSSKGTPVITYAINNNKPSVVSNNQVVATVQHSNGKIHIEFLQSGNASLTVEATVAEVVENVDYNQDGALDKVTYSPAFRSAWIPMEVGSAGTNPTPREYSLTNTPTLDAGNIPMTISGRAGQSVEYDEATASSVKGTPVITYVVDAPSIATVEHNNGKIKIQFLQSGAMSLTIRAEVPEIVENVDYDQDGALDKVTYRAASDWAWKSIRVEPPAPLNITVSNIVTLTTNIINPLPLPRGGISRPFEVPQATTLAGQAQITYNVPATIVTVNTRSNDFVEFSAAGTPGETTTMQIIATVPDITVQEDYNNDGVVDTVTYATASSTIDISVTLL